MRKATAKRKKKPLVMLEMSSLVVAGLTVPAYTAGAPEPTVGCDAADDAIYTSSAAAPGTPGQVISCRTTKLPHVPGNIPMNAWKVQYSSTNNVGGPVAVSGTVAVPKSEWRGPGPRPIVAFNPGTLGLGPQCAFSKQLAGEYQDAYEGDNISAALKAGYAVAATDGAGYLTGQTHPYVSGQDAGHTLLDIARAAPAVPGSGLDGKAPVGLWGYSEGGAASLWAAQLAASYAPDVKVVADASGGVPGDLKVVAKALDGGPFAGFLTDALVGLAAAHPQMPFDEIMNGTGKEAIEKAKSLCLVGTIANFAGQKVENYSTDQLSLDQMYALEGGDGTTWGEVVDRQKLGTGIGPRGSGAKYEIAFPVMQYRGLFDEVIPTETEDATRQAYCSAQVPTRWKTYPGEHLTADNQAVNDVVAWLGDRFAGETEYGNC
ncbi:hypothetical protein QF035_010432 [Streptomyces umbrinus]|uniref:Triacylglycerol lipase n=2 Tax=Streptomyces umbrinus TaxID=67370 RepID=A0ABU0TAR4_9ACTN|nr:hypothetical protein [Streptomyces umbrinus]